MSKLSTAEMMDRQYRFQRHVYDVTRAYYLLWRLPTIDGVRPPQNGVFVEVACGTGWNLIKAAQRYPNVQFFGLDISNEMLTSARSKITSQRLGQRVVVAQADATNFNLQKVFGCRAADRILISYALSMIPDWPAVIENALQALSGKGQIHIVDFGRMEAMPPAAKWVLRRWLQRFNVTPRDDLESTVSEISTRLGLKYKFEQSAMGYAVRAILTKP
jgi:S-adenosylmethionine-diacylgycerolhomoserine-N-methlytransferase